MLFEEICRVLKKAGIDDSDREAALLLEKFCGVPSASLPSRKNEDFSDPSLIRGVKLRASRYPLQYILGEWYFYGEKYIVNEHCLVPRPDTELLVELAIKKLPKNAVFADLCTGSGCVAVSTLAHRPDCKAFAFELYEDTLSLAKENARLNGVGDRFYPFEADVLKPLSVFSEGEAPFDAILSNPPYIRTSVIESLEAEVKHEPFAALDGGEDGLIFYRAILEIHSPLLRKDGFIAFEIGFDQGEQLKALAEKHSLECEILKDYGGNDRVAFLKKRI